MDNSQYARVMLTPIAAEVEPIRGLTEDKPCCIRVNE